MAETINQAYIGIGKMHVRLAGSDGPFRHVGNCSVANLKQTLDVQRQRDYTRPGGGTLKKVERIQSVDCDITMLSFNSANLALAVAGDATAVPGATIVNEVIKGHKDATARLAHPPLAVTSVTSAAGTTTYAVGTDYEATAGGLYFPSGSTIVEAADLQVDYTHADYARIEAGTKTATIVEVFFEGLNEGESNAAMLVDIWRLSLPPASELALIGDSMGELQFAAEVLKDPTKGTGVSAYWRARKVNPV